MLYGEIWKCLRKLLRNKKLYKVPCKFAGNFEEDSVRNYDVRMLNSECFLYRFKLLILLPGKEIYPIPV